MDYKYIKFCNTTCIETNSNKIKNDIKNIFTKNFELDLENINNDHKMVTSDFSKFNNKNNTCFSLYDDTNYFSLIFTKYNYKNLCILIDQTNKKYIIIKLRISDNLYNNTLIIGNIVNDEYWQFKVKDILIYDNK